MRNLRSLSFTELLLQFSPSLDEFKLACSMAGYWVDPPTEFVTKFILILLIALVFEAIGVVFLSGGLKQIGEPKTINAAEIASLVTRGATNKNILMGVFFEAIFFGFLLYLLSQKDVSIVWPLTALGFVITSLAARIFLKEEISGARWAGICLIVLGASLVTWSGKPKETAPEEQSPTSTDNGLR
jgi:drug/metabolite transporter (DMT)-like permease